MNKSSSTRPNQTESDQSQILFGGVAPIPSPEVFDEARKSNPIWVQLLENAYEQFSTLPENVGIYGDVKKGATLEQVWLFFTLLGVEPCCLLAHAVPKEQIQKITRLTYHGADELVLMLKKLQREDGFLNTATLHYDGKTGHCIRITSYDETRDRFIYHDPWPLNSLLCAENNVAGVRAQPEEKRWSVTSKELERVIFASFLFPQQWARLQGVKFDLYFDEWKRSDFFKFFNLKQLNKNSAGELSTRGFSVGPFNKSIVLILDFGRHNKVLRGILMLKRDWIFQNHMLAVDLGKSFIAAFAPAPDRLKYGEISQGVWSLRNGDVIRQVLEAPFGQSQIGDCLQTFLGAAKQGSIGTDFGFLSFENIVDEVEQMLKLEFKLF